MAIEVTDKGRAHLQSTMDSSSTIMRDISNHRIHHDVILFHLEQGEDLEDIFLELVDAASGSPEPASSKFLYEVGQAQRAGFVEGSPGLDEDESY